MPTPDASPRSERPPKRGGILSSRLKKPSKEGDMPPDPEPVSSMALPRIPEDGPGQGLRQTKPAAASSHLTSKTEAEVAAMEATIETMARQIERLTVENLTLRQQLSALNVTPKTYTPPEIVSTPPDSSREHQPFGGLAGGGLAGGLFGFLQGLMPPAWQEAEGSGGGNGAAAATGATAATAAASDAPAAGEGAAAATDGNGPSKRRMRFADEGAASAGGSAGGGGGGGGGGAGGAALAEVIEEKEPISPEALAAFKECDGDGNGHIDVEELGEALRALDLNMTNEQAQMGA